MIPMETIEDLIEEAKLRAVWWAVCIYCVTYFLSHTSSSMWMNLPISVIFVSALRLLLYQVEFRWKVRFPHQPQSYLSHLEKKQLSTSDPRLTPSAPSRWKRKIDSPVVEAAVGNFVDKILKDFVLDLWYIEITPDTEAAELMRAVIMDALGEISGRLKEINLVDLVTREVVDLVGDHLDLFRRNQAAIGSDVMMTLSTDERDERLKHHLINSKELHPALISSESEYKVLKRLISGVLAVVLGLREAQCPLVRTISRDILTSLVMQPVMDLASPWYINEVLEAILLTLMEDDSKEPHGEISEGVLGISSNSSKVNEGSSHEVKFGIQSRSSIAKPNNVSHDSTEKIHTQETGRPHVAEWARVLEVATQKRTEVLAPENLENMWAKGRNYKKKEMIKSMPVVPPAPVTGKTVVQLPRLTTDSSLTNHNSDVKTATNKRMNDASSDRQHAKDDLISQVQVPACENQSKIKRSSSASFVQTVTENNLSTSGNVGRHIISEFYIPNFERQIKDEAGKRNLEIVVKNEESHSSKLKCRVVGAYFEKLGSKSFAVYSIAVTNVSNKTWFVKRRYRNFERLHRHLKDIPNYSLQLPPKRIFSSSTEDAFVHQRCIQLDKYLHDLLSIANIAEQHEVWDFLSDSSKNYSFVKSPSVMKTLAVNVDDAVDDIVRQFKGVSGGFMRTIVGTSPLDESGHSIGGKNLSWHGDDLNRYALNHDMLETATSNSENEEISNHDDNRPDNTESDVRENGWYSDDELKSVPPHMIYTNPPPEKDNFNNDFDLHLKPDLRDSTSPVSRTLSASNVQEDALDMPPEWTPTNVSVPLLNLVDKVFQLNRRGWLRRQVFWISKQILQLMMEDAIDDWILRQICFLRKEDTVAEGIRWVQNILWPGGIFFTKLRNQSETAEEQDVKPFNISQYSGRSGSKHGSFEEELEAARRVSNIRKILFEGAPTALVSLIGHKQYRRCARDIFYFTQSTVCMKQLAYAILELTVVSVFPELRDLMLEVHGRSPPQKSNAEHRC